MNDGGEVSCVFSTPRIAVMWQVMIGGDGFFFFIITQIIKKKNTTISTKNKIEFL